MPNRVLITGVAGFVGSMLAKSLTALQESLEIVGVDNLARSGAAHNLGDLGAHGVRFHHADVRSASDLENLPPCRWIVDAAAHPSVLAGLSPACSSRQLIENNLLGTANLLELCRKWDAGLVLLSSSRVYSIGPLAALPVIENDRTFVLDSQASVEGVSQRGICESFSTTPPVSLYGATKLASETIALEYGHAFGFPVWVNRCGVLAGGTQFGRPEQGIFAYWLHTWKARLPLRYLGFGGRGLQVRDCLHPRDLASLVSIQMAAGRDDTKPSVVNVSGGIGSARSLAQLSDWCRERWGDHPIDSDDSRRPFDLPWIVLDHHVASECWGWRPVISTDEILTEIAAHAEQNPNWRDLSNLY